MIEGRKTFVFDLDGTICSQTAGGDEYASAVPNPLVVDCVRKLAELGHEIVIYTARGMKTISSDGRRLSKYDMAKEAEDWLGPSTSRWLEDNGVPFDRLVFGKPSGDYYIDDKGMSVGYLIEILGVA